MSDTNELFNKICRVIVGSIRYTTFEQIPDDHYLKQPDILPELMQRLNDAGATSFLFYLYNNNKMVTLLNDIHKKVPTAEFLLIVKYDTFETLTSLLGQLNFKPIALILDYTLTDRRDTNLINKYLKTLRKNTNYFGGFSREPIGTVSIFVNAIADLDIYLIPFNMRGLGLQNRSLAEMIVNSTNKLYIGANPLANGKIQPRPAFEYISQHKIHSALIELTDKEQMLESIKHARYFFETHDFLKISLEFEDIAEVCEYCGLGMERYYPPSGGSYFYCPQCENTKPIVTDVDYTEEKEKK